MLSTFACTILMTLCIDTGLKPLDDGSDMIYVIQMSPEQCEQMMKGKFVTSAIPPGAVFKEIRIQVADEKLSFPDPLLTEARKPDATLAKPPPDSIIPTSMNSSSTLLGDSPRIEERRSELEVSTPKVTRPVEKPMEPKETAPAPSQNGSDKKTEASGEQESYLMTAIVSWVVSAALFAMLVYLLWIHLDMRRRYQVLLSRTLEDPMSDLFRPSSGAGSRSAKRLPAASDPTKVSAATAPTLSSLMVPLSETLQTTSPPSSFSQKPDRTSRDTFASAAEKPVGTSTLKKSETFELPEEEEKIEEVEPDEKKYEETETVFELPEASDDEPPEEEDLTRNWEGVE